MNTYELHDRAQKVMDNADQETADLLDEVWSALQSREKEVTSLRGVLDYWKVRASMAEDRILGLTEIKEKSGPGENPSVVEHADVPPMPGRKPGKAVKS